MHYLIFMRIFNFFNMYKYVCLVLLLSLFLLVSCDTDPEVTYHQCNQNTTNHHIKLIIYSFNKIDSTVILPQSLFKVTYSEFIGNGFMPFDFRDSIAVYIDSFYCNTYYRCLLFKDDIDAFHKCINDSFNILNPDLYNVEKVKEYEWNCSFTMDEKFCSNCR
jgi:hypothetical protein